MGCYTEIVCKTCQTIYYCGYGSYNSIEKREALFNKAEHNGHDYISECGEGTYVEGEDLHVLGLYASNGPVIVAGYTKFKYVDLTKAGIRSGEVHPLE